MGKTDFARNINEARIKRRVALHRHHLEIFSLFSLSCPCPSSPSPVCQTFSTFSSSKAEFGSEERRGRRVDLRDF